MWTVLPAHGAGWGCCLAEAQGRAGCWGFGGGVPSAPLSLGGMPLRSASHRLQDGWMVGRGSNQHPHAPGRGV